MAGRTFDISELIDGRPLGLFNYKLIILSWLITVFDGFDMLMVSFTAPYMAEELKLDKSMLGNVFSAGLLGMMLGGFLFSWLGDRIGRRPTVVVTAFAFGILTIATGFARSYEALVLLRLLDGMAIGGMLPLAWALNIEFVPTRMRSTVVTVIMVGYGLGAALAGPLTVALAPGLGWQAVFFAGGGGTLIAAALLCWGLPESVRFLVSRNRGSGVIAASLNRAMPDLDVDAQDRFVASNERVAREEFKPRQLFEGRLRVLTPLLWVGYVASTLAIFFTASWGPIVLEEMAFGRNTAAYVSSLGVTLGAVLGLVLMRFTDGRGPFAVAVYPLIAVPLLLIVGLVPLSSVAFLALSTLGVVLLVGAHFGIQSIVGIFYPSAIRASGGGWAASIAKIGGTAGPIIGGAALASGMPASRTYALLAVCPAVLALSAIGIGLVVRHYPAVPRGGIAAALVIPAEY